MATDRHDGQVKIVSPGVGARPGSPVGRPWLAFARFSTPGHDEYLRAFRPLRLEGFLLDSASRPWGVARCRLDAVVVEHGVDGAAWAATGSVAEGSVVLVFSGGPDGALRVDGHDAVRDVVIVPPSDARTTLVARRPGDWYAVAIPADRLPKLAARKCSAAGGSSVPGRFRPEDLARLRALAARTMTAASAAAPPEPAREGASTLEAALLSALEAGLSTPAEGAPRAGCARVPRHEVLEKLDRLLEARSSEPVYVADLCAATGLPERTLRYVLVEQYGTSPIRLLRNRRLCQLRRALVAEAGPAESLSRLAERHGFWHMGTLAADYRHLFGELPSETRRAAAEGAVRRPGSAASALVQPGRARQDVVPAAVAVAVADR